MRRWLRRRDDSVATLDGARRTFLALPVYVAARRSGARFLIHRWLRRRNTGVATLDGARRMFLALPIYVSTQAFWRAFSGEYCGYFLRFWERLIGEGGFSANAKFYRKALDKGEGDGYNG